MRFTALSALLGLLAVQQAAAGGSESDWSCSPGFPICSKSSNHCSNPQKSGVSCAEESQPKSGPCTGVQGMGVSNANYGTMKIKSKRSLFPRGAGRSASSGEQKCIKQTVGSTKGSGITIDKGSGSQYSCTAHHIAVGEQPVDVQITHYYAHSDQTCSYHQLCNANEVTTINNDNCGQSDKHEVCVHPSSPSGPSAEVGIVGMDFNCVPAQSSTCSPPHASSSFAPPKSSAPVVVPSYPSKPLSVPLSTAPKESSSVTASSPSLVQSGSTTAVVVPSSTPSPSVASSSPIESGTTTPLVSQSSAPSPSVTPSSPIESGTTTPVVSASSTLLPSVTPSSISPVQSGTTTVPVETETTSLTTYTTLTSCPVTSTTVVSGSTSTIVKTSLITSTITTCHRCIEKTSTPVAPPPPSSAVPPPPPSSSAVPPPPPSSSAVPPPPVATTTTPGSPQESGTTSAVLPPPVVYTSTPVVLTTTTEIVLTTLTTCPVTKTITPLSQPPTVVTTTTVSTVLTTSTSTITTTTLSPPPSSPVPVVPAQSAFSISTVVPPAQPSTPSVFKGCISAWYDLKGCGSNSDYDCYCQHDEVTTKVYECITSYEQDVAKQAAAMASYQGLCHDYFETHTVIIAKSVQLIPTPVSTPAGSSPVVPASGSVTPAPVAPVEVGQTTTTTAPVPANPAPTPAPSGSGPVTTVPVSVAVAVPCSAVAGVVNQITDGQVQVAATGAMAPGCSTTSIFSTQLAVTPMYFATSGTSVGLAAGTPAANEAAATATAVPVPGVAGVAGASGTATPPASSGTSAPVPSTFKGAAVKTSHSGVVLSLVLAAVGLVVYA